MDMKKIETTRKHGYKARAAQIGRWLCIQTEKDSSDAPSLGHRLKRELTFRSSSQSYVWVTDRGRSRLIKH